MKTARNQMIGVILGGEIKIWLTPLPINYYILLMNKMDISTKFCLWRNFFFFSTLGLFCDSTENYAKRSQHFPATWFHIIRPLRVFVFIAPLEAVLWRWSLWALHPSLNIDKIGIPVSFGKSTFSIILGISLMSLSSTRRAPPVSWHPYMTSAEYHDMASTSAKGFWKRIAVRVTGDSNRGSGSTPDSSLPTSASSSQVTRKSKARLWGILWTQAHFERCWFCQPFVKPIVKNAVD